ncbi:hypothetical protein CLF_113587, partial [Clonorchis sinensis]
LGQPGSIPAFVLPLVGWQLGIERVLQLNNFLLLIGLRSTKFSTSTGYLNVCSPYCRKQSHVNPTGLRLSRGSRLGHNRSSMDICVDAPLAPLEVDILSDDSSSRGQICTNEPVQCRRSDGSLLTDQSDLDLLCSGSLTDLVLNFDDRVYNCFNQPIEQSVVSGTAFPSTVVNAKTSLARDATLSEVKFWWKEAVGEPRKFDYPFESAPDKLGMYEDFESADADGITEDENIHLPVIYAFGRKGLEDEVIAEPDTSFQGHVTTDSECSSSFSARATTPDRSERRSLSPCVERVDESVPNDALTLPDELQAVLSSLLVSDQPPSVLT